MKRGLLLLAIALIVAGIAATISSASAQKHASRADDWDQKRGIVERLDGGTVAYRYEAGGATHRGTAPARPRAIYRVGRPVLVYVNPAAPADSLLDLPPRPPTWPMLAGGLMLLVGAAFGFFAWQEGRKQPPAAPTSSGPKIPPVKVPGDTTARRKAAPPLSRLKPPPAPAWRRPVQDEAANEDADS